MPKILCQNYTWSYPKHFATTNYLRIFEVLTYKFLLFHSHYLYIYVHWGANLTSCTHLHLKRKFSCHLYTLEGQFHIIYSFGKHPRAIFDMGTFFKRLIMLPIHKYTYFERHFFAIHSHFARYFYATYIHIYTYRWKVFSMLPRCKIFLMGQQNLNSNKNLSNMS